ncbi:glycosyltransferase family 4 protein [Microterricola viridarii]|uniref:D-inositol 3-phosphate glycosyltransferase n=1 Tax=Microterricola viridarii TaxID=412690 RepID=A0A1H1P8T3_9MICO|nr:glycosyltransferase family 4 protein [Microterricola viridarii]SDS07554.1 Glycosyltransferase involved in cell wall bisynthesis [Microterricola viridarii]
MSSLRVLIIVQNLPVPLDRRVWLECKALADQGYSVSVICPKGPGDPSYQLLDGIGIYKYRPAPEAQGVLGFAVEFIWSWLLTAGLSIRVRRERGFDVIQACNPPDTYWLLAALWRVRGVRFVFDQHDLNPELFLSRFGEPRSAAMRVQYRGLLWLERMTYRVADRVISTNASYKAVAERRGRRDPSSVTVVRSGPDTRLMRPVYPDAGIRGGAEHLICYLGIMGPQDGVDTLLDVMEELVHRRGRTGVHAVLLGFGDCLDDLKARCTALGLDSNVRFTGRVGPAEIAQYLSASDLGVGPDQKTPLNDISTMNKTMEYMAYALPSVSVDLVETRVSVGDTGVLVPSGDIAAFADALESLLDNPERRVELGIAARRRVVEELDWKPQAQAYVGVFDDLLNNPAGDDRLGRWPHSAAALGARGENEPRPVDLLDEAEFARFVRERCAPAASVRQSDQV